MYGTAKNVRSGMICLREPESFREELDTDVWGFDFCFSNVDCILLGS